MLLVEHPPVYTLGKSGTGDHLLLDEAGLIGHGVAFHDIDRGGDITYHGPGQIVGYPILDLDRISTDLHRYLRHLEEVIIRSCADYGLPAGRVVGRTGVWVGLDEAGGERKICAMGIRCSRWVTMHGFAFNVNTDLSYFEHIVPCGITDRGVTTLARELGRPVDESEARARVIARFAEVFEADVTLLRGAEARAFLDGFAGPPAPPAQVRAAGSEKAPG
jgi:lipoyl(octanoyl) transferase